MLQYSYCALKYIEVSIKNNKAWKSEKQREAYVVEKTYTYTIVQNSCLQFSAFTTILLAVLQFLTFTITIIFGSNMD